MPQSLVFMPRQSRGLCREVTWCLALSSTQALLFHHRVAISQTHLWNTCPIPSCPEGLQEVVSLPTMWDHLTVHTAHVPWIHVQALPLCSSSDHVFFFNTPCAHFSNTIVLRYSHPFHSHFCSLFPPCSFPRHPVTTALICGNVLLARPRNHPAVKQHFLLKIFNRILYNTTLCSSPSHLVMSMLEVSR